MIFLNHNFKKLCIRKYPKTTYLQCSICKHIVFEFIDKSDYYISSTEFSNIKNDGEILELTCEEMVIKSLLE